MNEEVKWKLTKVPNEHVGSLTKCERKPENSTLSQAGINCTVSTHTPKRTTVRVVRLSHKKRKQMAANLEGDYGQGHHAKPDH